MPLKADEFSTNSLGGTELMKRALQERLIAAGRQDLLDYFDIYPSRIRAFDPNRPSIYWAHDLAIDAEAQHLTSDQYLFSAIVFVSHWQQQQFQQRFSMARQHQVVIPNAIQLFDPKVSQKWTDPDLGSVDKPLQLIYHTTPHRGLELLVPVFDQISSALAKQQIHLRLDVFSSFAIYGWQQLDEKYAALFDICRKHPFITYHGSVPNEQIREALTRSHVFAYPCTWPETSCLSLIEAMGSGCVCIHSNLAALPETSGGMTVCYPFLPAPAQHAHAFASTLHSVLMGLISSARQKQRPIMTQLAMQRVNTLFNWDNRVREWIGFLDATRARINNSR